MDSNSRCYNLFSKIMTMTQEDRELLTWYFYGFNDELNKKSRVMDCSQLQKKAYSIGARHAFSTDESLDYLSDAQTLEIIKSEYKNEKEKTQKNLG